MKRILAVLLVLGALSLVGCGGGGSAFSNVPLPGPTPTGSFSAASLNGRYVYTLRGISATYDFNTVGAFTADGAGHLSSGTEDAFVTPQSQISSSFTGTYTVTADGRGEAVLNFSGSSTPVHMRFVLVSTDRGRIIEMEQAENAIGTLQRQDAGATLSGNYVFRFDGYAGGGAYTAVGGLTASGGGLNGVVDENNDGVFTAQSAATGTFTVAAGGRGTAAIAWGGITKHIVFYVVSSSRVEFVGVDATPFVAGYAAQQTGTPFSNASLNSGFIFSMSGFTGAGSIREAGRFTADGSGNLLSGIEDLIEASTVSDSVAFTGGYTMANSGRAPMQLNFGGTNYQFVLWMTSAANGILMAADNQAVESGVLTKQTGTFSNASLNGAYALRLSGENGSGVQDTVAQIRADGAGNITGNQDANVNGLLYPGVSLPGTYTVSANGRATGTLDSTPFRMYLADSNTWYSISADSNVRLLGVGEKQQ